MTRSHRFALLCALTLLLGCPTDDDDDISDDDDVSADDDDTQFTDDDTSDTAEVVVAPTGIKQLLLEEFTNTGCGPCAAQNPTIDAFLEAVGVGNVVPAKIHPDWPDPADPFYLTSTADYDARVAYYGVDGVPDTIIDGLYDLSWYGGNYTSDIAAYYAGDLLVDLGLTWIDPGDGTHDLQVQLLATDALDHALDLQLRVMATQRFVVFDTAPGSNGESEFHDGVIGMLPDADGTPITIGPGEEQAVDLTFELTGDWEADELQFVAFVQDDATREVLQALTTEAPPEHSLRVVETEPDGVVMEADETRTFTFTVVNSGRAADTVDVAVEADAAAGWSVTASSPDADLDAPVALDSGAAVTVQVDVDPAGMPGSLSLSLQTTPEGLDEPAVTTAVDVLTYGAEVLLVDADGGDDYDTYFSDTLTAAGYDHVVWRSEVDFDTLDLSRFEVVVWNAGWYFPHFVDEEKAALTAYLDGGGKVFFSGQDIGWDLSEDGTHGASASSWLDVEFYEATMHAEYMNDDADAFVVYGLPGDPITEGLVFDIAGGTGADNQDYPSWVEPLGADSELILEYETGYGCGVRALHGTGKVVYLSFGFEAVADQTSREQLMANILAWLTAP